VSEPTALGTADAEAHDHAHADVSGGWLRAAVFGAMDGLVSNTALVAGVGGGGAPARTIVLTGVAGLIAGAISMALGEFTSVKTQNEQLDLEVAKERHELEHNEAGEIAELTGMIRARGVQGPVRQPLGVPAARGRRSSPGVPGGVPGGPGVGGAEDLVLGLVPLGHDVPLLSPVSALSVTCR
jgi:hypothetical protein